MTSRPWCERRTTLSRCPSPTWRGHSASRTTSSMTVATSRKGKLWRSKKTRRRGSRARVLPKTSRGAATPLTSASGRAPPPAHPPPAPPVLGALPP